MTLIRSIDCADAGEKRSPWSSPLEALGGVETRSIALGLEVADAMLKAAEVGLLMSTPTCPGKYLVLVTGTVAAVRAAVEAGSAAARDSLVDMTVIPSVHPQVVPALSAAVDVTDVASLGVIETFSMTAALRAGDQAVKSAAVTLVEIRLGRALAGKAFVILTGEVSAVRAAVAAGVKAVEDQALILATTVIPTPHPALLEKLW
jgi:microcompartment protein CcmL/EutN